MNPFEGIFSRPKHRVLNRKVKGVSGKRGFESNALNRPSNRGSSTFIDKRFGEHNASLSLEDKLMARFIAEKKKKQNYNLNEDDDDDDDGGGENLTHFGQSLSTMDDDMFSKISRDVDDVDPRDNGMIDKHTVAKAHFGGFDDQDVSDRKKSKNEIMQEIIKKSKFHKAERQRLKDENETLIKDVDDDLEDIRGLLHMSQKEMFENREKSDFDTIVKELAYEKRVTPSDRMKTDEEIAMLEKEKLENLERMNPTSESQLGTKRRTPQADDLDELSAADAQDEDEGGLQYDEDGVLVAGTFAISKRRKLASQDEGDPDEMVMEDESSGDDDDSEASESSIEDISDIKEVEDTLNTLEESSGEESEITAESQVLDQSAKSASVELPYVFECPTSYESLLELLSERSASDCNTILQRIRALYSIKLSPANKDKMLAFLKLLLVHLRKLCDQRQQKLPIAQINSILKNIHPLALQLPQYFSQYCKEQIIKMHDRLTFQFEQGKIRKFPAPSALIFIQMLGKIYSTSDYKHPVISPVILLCCEYLSECPIKSDKDIACGLYLCGILREFQLKSKRLIPEVLNFLNRVIVLLCGRKRFEDQIPGAFPLHSQDSSSMEICDWNADVTGSLNIAHLLCQSDSSEVSFDDITRLQALDAASTLLQDFSAFYSTLLSYTDLFKASAQILQALPNLKSQRTSDTKEHINEQISISTKSLKPLMLQLRKPVSIRTYLPKFNDNYSIDRKSNDPNRERAEKQKVARQYKKEFRGAAREMRKDGGILARQRVNQTKERDAAYKKKIDGIMGGLANQEGAMRGYEKSKK